MVFNEATGDELRLPEPQAAGRPRLLDLMPGWPVYVLIEIGLVISVWALLTWAFDRRDRRGSAAR